MAAERSVVIRLKGEISDFRAKMAQASASTKGFTKELEDASKRASFDQLGRAAGRIGLVAAAGFGLAVKKAADFDQAMSNVAASGADAAANMEGLRDAALQAGAETAFSASEAAAGIENLAKAGVSAADIIGGALSGALDLAAAGTIDVASAAEYVATAMTQFSLSGEDAVHVADLLAAGAGKAQGEVTDMADALNYVGVPAANLGVSIEQTAGSIALLAKNGILGSQAGTSLRGVLSSLTSPSRIAAEEMKKFGINVFNAQGQFLGFEGVAAQLQERLGGLTDQERANALGRIFGNEQLQAANVLYREGADGIREWTTAVNDQGYAAQAAQTRLNNLKGDFEQLSGSVETLLITLGEGSQGPLRQTTQNLTELVNALNGAPSAIQNTVVKMVALTAITAGAAWFGAKVIGGIANTKVALTEMGVSAQVAGSRLKAVGKGVGLLSVVTLVGSLADELGRVKTTDLERSLTALGQGKVTDNVQTIVDDLEYLNSWDNKIDFGELVTGFGIFGDSTMDKMQDNLDAVDQLLASMVESGDTSGAVVLFKQITSLAAEQGVSVDDAAKSFDAYQLALENTGGAAGDAASATGDLTGATGELSAEQQAAAQAAEEQAAAIEAARQAASDTAGEFFNLGDSVDDSKVSLSEWIDDLNAQAKALKNFRINAQEAAKKGLDEGLIAALEEAGPAGALRMQQLANASDREIRRANKAWQNGERQIGLYTDAVGGVPSNVSTNISVTGVDSAISQLSVLDQLFPEPGTYGVGLGVLVTAPSSTTFPGNYAEGGYTGNGSKYQPAGVVHAGEFVFSAAATRGNLAYLSGLHNQLKGYASGGFVAASRPAPAYQAADVAAVMAAASASRPTVQYGDIHIQPHNYDDWLRQQRQDLARASTGGLRR